MSARDRLRVLTPAFLRVAVLVVLAITVGYALRSDGRPVGCRDRPRHAARDAPVLRQPAGRLARGAAARGHSQRNGDLDAGVRAPVPCPPHDGDRTSEGCRTTRSASGARSARCRKGIVLVDLSLQIEWCNPVAEAHLGVSLTGDHGMRVTNLVRDPAFVSYMTSGQYDLPLEFRPMARPNTALEVRVIEVERTRLMVISRDITQREQVDAMRRDFIANVSHELAHAAHRGQRLHGDAARRPARGRGDAAAPPRLMQEQAQRMSRLVEDLLTLSRLESSESSLVEEIVDVQLLMSEVADEARVLSGGRHRVEVEAGDAPSCGQTARNCAARSATWCRTRFGTRRTAGASRWLVDARRGYGRFEVQRHRHRCRAGARSAPDGTLLPRRQESLARDRWHRSRSRDRQARAAAARRQARHRSDVGKGSTFAAVFPASRIVTPK